MELTNGDVFGWVIAGGAIFLGLVALFVLPILMPIGEKKFFRMSNNNETKIAMSSSFPDKASFNGTPIDKSTEQDYIDIGNCKELSGGNY